MTYSWVQGAGRMVSTPLGLVWIVGGLITYVSLAVNTWRSPISVPFKLLLNLTLDVIFAAAWPIMWTNWIFDAISHHLALGY
jgi:hypothetical protein